jgi:hypothetical protein
MSETFDGQPAGWANEQALLRRAVSEINRLRPAFAIVCGDLINEFPSDEGAETVTRRQQVPCDAPAPRVLRAAPPTAACARVRVPHTALRFSNGVLCRGPVHPSAVRLRQP